ncbi:MAG TPA: hypothetical protein VNX65_02345 [Patescibacteria group bacterium]|jgi:hypothetical protein|nr:hypothetical protein [Patescibacteria group bacterium]
MNSKPQLPKIGFTIPVLNNFKGCVEAIASIKTEHQFEVYLEEQWRANKPLSQAWNDGFDRAVAGGCEYIFIINDDILFDQDGVDNLVKEMDRLEKDNVVLVSSNNIIGELSDPYHVLAHQQPYVAPASVADHPNYSCFMVKRNFMEKVGRFDENFKPAWFEDNDSHRRIEMLGYRAICTTASSCVHFGGVSTALMSNPSSEKSRQYYAMKWGGMPEGHGGKEAYDHPYNNPELTAKDWIPNYAG